MTQPACASAAASSEPQFAPRFAELISPFPVERFFSDYWETKPLVIEGEAPERFQHLITVDEADRILTTLHLHAPEIRLARGEEKLQLEDFTRPGGAIDALAISQSFADGTTFIFDQMQRRVPALSALCRALEAELGPNFQTNLYLTPSRSQGFKTHFDTHDVLILQVAGSKLWKLYESKLELPLPGQDHESSGQAPGAQTAEFTLKAGDLAYIPRGLYHDALSDDSVSLYITLGAIVRSWCELFIEAISELSLRDVAFRRSIPLGLGTRAFDTQGATATFGALSRRLAAELDGQAAFDSFAEEFRRRHDLDLEGQLSQMIVLGELTSASVVALRPGLVFEVLAKGDTVTLHYSDREISLPAKTGISLDFLLSGRKVAVAEIPGPLDIAGKTTLVRRLIREGLIEVVPT